MPSSRPIRRFAVVAAVVLPLAFSAAGVPTGLVGAAHAEGALVLTKPFTDSRRLVEMDVHISTYYGSGIGPGVDILIPLVKNGFIPTLNNAVYLGFAIDPLFHSNELIGGTTVSLATSAFVEWRFIIVKVFKEGHLDAFSNLGAGARTFFSSGGVSAGWFPMLDVGATLFFTRGIGVRAVAGWSRAEVGVAFAF